MGAIPRAFTVRRIVNAAKIDQLLERKDALVSQRARDRQMILPFYDNGDLVEGNDKTLQALTERRPQTFAQFVETIHHRAIVFVRRICSAIE